MNIVIRPPLPEILDPPLIKGHVYYTSRLRVTEMLGGMSCKAFFIQQCCQSFNSLNAQVHIYEFSRDHNYLCAVFCVDYKNDFGYHSTCTYMHVSAIY